MNDQRSRKNALRRYWLIYGAGDGDGWRLFTLEASGRELLPVFSFREEAEMYLALTPHSSDLRVEEADAAEMISVLGNLHPGVSGVALDPIPEFSGAALLDLLSVSLEEFTTSALGKSSYSPRAFGER